MFKVTVMQMIDYEISGDKSHVSISGGVATHSFDKIDEFNAKDLNDVIKTITVNYGTPFIFEDRLELQLSENKTLSFYIEQVTVKPITHSKLKKSFKHLETY